MVDEQRGNSLYDACVMTDASNNSTERHALRQRLLAGRRALDTADVQQLSHSLAQRLYPLLNESTHVAGYLAIGNEVDIASVLERCQHDNKQTYLPLVADNNRMSFVAYDSDTSLVANRYGILEPAAESARYRAPGTLDVVLVPLVGFDGECNRMGMGGGYYDRAFAERKNTHNTTSASNTPKPLLIGVAYDLQRVDTVFPDWWDVPLDVVVTPTEVITHG